MLKTYRSALTLIVLTLTVSSCAGGWNEEDKKLFTKDCRDAVHSQLTEAQAKTYCDCFTEKMVKAYPVFNDAMEHIDSAKVEGAKAECRKAIGMQ